MAHLIEQARSGRAVCKTCQEPIAQGELRFGEEMARAYAGRPAVRWHHLACAASSCPAKLLEAMAAYPGELPGRARLEARAQAAQGALPPVEFPFAERGAGPVTCKGCGREIAPGSLRIAVERREDFAGYARLGAAYLHPECGPAAGLGEHEEALIRTHSRGLAPGDLEALGQALQAPGSP